MPTISRYAIDVNLFPPKSTLVKICQNDSIIVGDGIISLQCRHRQNCIVRKPLSQTHGCATLLAPSVEDRRVLTPSRLAGLNIFPVVSPLDEIRRTPVRAIERDEVFSVSSAPSSKTHTQATQWFPTGSLILVPCRWSCCEWGMGTVPRSGCDWAS